jgi:TonB-linked SusC/RagA family outer membrane protein
MQFYGFARHGFSEGVAFCHRLNLCPGALTKTARVMKLTAILLLAACLQVSARSYSQTINLSEKNVPLEKIFRAIKAQSGYTFVYRDEWLGLADRVTLDLHNASIEEALDACFKNQPLAYRLVKKTVVVTLSSPAFQRKDSATAPPSPPLDIEGVVTDADGKPLQGVSITVKGTKKGTETDMNGAFSLKGIDRSSVLVFSIVGYQSQEVVVGDARMLKIQLKQLPATLGDVVVIGYGSQRRGDVNGAVSSVKSADIANIPQPSVDQLLQGKAAGITIAQNSGAPGSNTSVHIRGITSLSLSNEPLYVIDGVPISGDANNIATSGRPAALSNKGQIGQGDGETSASPLSLIDPADIESIDILKDASATAIYGSRASNGVIIITTKTGKAGTAHLNYNGYYGVSQQGKFLDMMNLTQYANLENVLADVYHIARRGEFADPSLLGLGTDWQKEIFRSAAQQNHQVSASGGRNGMDYYVSGGYFDQQGTVIGNDFNRYGFRANVNGKVKDWLKLGTAISGSRTMQNQSLSDNSGIIYTALLSAPDQVVYNADGTYAGPQIDQVGGLINPVAEALDITNNLSRSNLNGNIYNEIRFFKDLTLRSEVTGNFNYSNAKVFLPTYQYGPLFSNATAKLIEYQSNSTEWSWKEYMTYQHTFGLDHEVSVLLGHEVSESSWSGVDNSVQSFLSNDLQTLGLGDAKTATIGEYKASQSLESAFARAIYTFRSKYSVTATIRSDRSSKFAEGHQTGYFPSFAASWKLSEEPFFRKIKQVADHVRLRIGYGEVGNQGVPNYLYGAALTAFPTGLGTGFALDKIANPSLTWETAIQKDLGLDFTLLNERIEGSFDYYSKTSKNFIFQTPLPAFLVGQPVNGPTGPSYGVVKPPFVNGGQVDNRGFEFSIHSRNIETGNFKWSTTLIFSHYINKVVSLVSGTSFIPGSITLGFLNLPVSRTQPGGPIGEFYGYKVDGIFRTAKDLQDAPVQFGRPIENSNAGTWFGDVRYQDLNGDGVIDVNDQTRIGNPNPKFTYSISNSFSYKTFDLSIFLNGSYGARIFNALNYQLAGLSGLFENQLAAVADFWTPANPGSNIPAPRPGDNPNLFNSDRFIESGSYLRVQNISLGYTFPARLINQIKLTRLRLFVSGQNLYVFTPYKGLDPEIGALNQNVFLTNVDLGRYPIPRTISFGINATF